MVGYPCTVETQWLIALTDKNEFVESVGKPGRILQ